MCRYGENYANIGSVANRTAGSYLLRRSVDFNEQLGFQPHGKSCDQAYAGCVNSLTTDGTILKSCLVRNNGSDLAYVQGLLQESSVSTVKRSYTCKDVPSKPITNATFVGLSNNTALETLELPARLEARNLPIDTNLTSYVRDKLRVAGIANGRYRKPHGVNITEAYAAFNAFIARFNKNGVQKLGNGRGRYVPQGRYVSNYTARAHAVKVHLANTEDQPLYPLYDSSETELSLSNSQAYMYAFSSKPPVESDGFWSLIVYKSSGYFVANSVNVYEVGDRSNITYLDGQQVCGANASTVDEPFQILI